MEEYFNGLLGLKSFVKTTGGKGLHLVVPIARRQTCTNVKAFCKQVADAIVTVAPLKFTANMAKAARTNTIFVDYLRNSRGATAVIPYSPRARAGAPVSTLLTWAELSSKVASDRFTVSNIRRRLARLNSDPWETLPSLRQSLTEAQNRLNAVAPVR